MLRFQGSSDHRRRKWVTGLALLILVLALANSVRMGVAVTYWRRLPQLPMTVSMLYLAGGGLIWAVAFGISALGLFRFRAWGRWATLTAATSYAIHMWFNHLCFEASAYPRQSWGGEAVESGALLAAVWLFLNLRGIKSVLE